jgi:adenylate cyclase
MAETRKLAAILAADVAGYSKLAAADEERTLARLRALRSDLFDPTTALHHGRVVKRTGDGVLMEFRSVVDAVRCAIEVQNGMAERNTGLPPERRIEFRVGIHLGDVVEESDGDLMGDGVNIAARLEGIAKPGTICLSEDAYRQVKSRLDLAVSDLGAIQLKNIAEPVRVYSLQVGKAAQPKRTTPAVPRQLSTLALLGAGVLAAMIATGALYFFSAHRPATTVANAPAAPKKHFSIVILPFANLSNDSSQDYFADAITENLTTAVSRYYPDSFVIARNTAFTFKGKNVDTKQIGKDLGVQYVLEGSVQRDPNRVRVNAQLIDADTGAHLWADKFESARTELLQMQDEIVTRLANSLGIGVVKAVAEKSALSTNPDEWDLVWQCASGLRKAGFFGQEADASYRLCERALDANPNNIVALDLLAVKFSARVLATRSADPQADLKRADELLSRALAIDANFGLAHAGKGQVLRAERRFDEAITEFERALTLDPSRTEVFGFLGAAYVEMGQYEKAIEFLDKSILLSPRDRDLFSWYFAKSYAYFSLQQDDQAIEWARQSIAVNPNFSSSRAVLAAALALTGHEAEARDEEQRRNAVSPFKSIKAAKAVLTPPPSADLRVRAAFDRIIEGLRKAGMPEE